MIPQIFQSDFAYNKYRRNFNLPTQHLKCSCFLTIQINKLPAMIPRSPTQFHLQTYHIMFLSRKAICSLDRRLYAHRLWPRPKPALQLNNIKFHVKHQEQI